ncbi:MAG: EAL domain-containing protein [Aquabacterium sp.]|nr:MAG: EAL domain-containing protein [Aquabacterium sp.]
MLRRRLDYQIVTLFLGLLLGVQAFSFLLIRHSIDSNARAALRGELSQGELVFQRLLDQNADHLLQASRLLAADYGFRAAVASDDRETLASALDNHGARLNAQVALFTDTRFSLKASAGRYGSEVLGHLRRMAGEAAAGRGDPKPAILVLGGVPHQVVMVPVRAPLPIGWVVMGFRLDEGLLHDMRKLAALDVVVLQKNGQKRWRATMGTLDDADGAAVASQWSSLPAAPARASAPVGDTMAAVRVKDADYLGSLMPLNAGQDQNVSAVLLRSIDEAVAPYRRLQVGILVLTAVGVFVFALGSIITARRITTPLSTLTRLARRLGSGDFAVAMPPAGDDEIGELAEAFESMRVAVREREAEITRLAFVDALTDLPNRVQFAREVRDAATASLREGAPTCAVLLVDLDRFKHVNDVLGHETGDHLLLDVSRRLRALLQGPLDCVARLGADQFALLLHGCNLEGAQVMAARIAQALETPLTIDDHRIDLSAGIGIALCPEHATDGTTLLRRAEIALAHAKQAQLGAVLFTPDQDVTSAQSLSLLSELRVAVAASQLRLYLQPKVLLRTAEVVGAEALVRWEHPQRGLVPPMQFIPFAEQTGFIRTLTHWLLVECARTWREWADRGLMLELSLNLSARDLIDQDLPEKVKEVLALHGVDPRALCLEITESSIMDDPQRALNTLHRLHDQGLRLAIDDFGTGYSSLAYLKRLPVDELKIDRSFVMNMERDVDDAKIVRSTIDLAHNLGLKVVAEGLETAPQWKLLDLLSCDQAQGYWVARPMPKEQFPAWVRQWQKPPVMDEIRLPSAFADFA